METSAGHRALEIMFTSFHRGSNHFKEQFEVAARGIGEFRGRACNGAFLLSEISS